MGKYLIKYILLTLLIYTGIGAFYLLVSGLKTMPMGDTIIVMIEAGYDVKNEWAYKTEKIITELQNRYSLQNFEVYYFNRTYETVIKDSQDRFEFADVQPYGSVDYSLIDKFSKETGKKINFLIGSPEVKKHNQGIQVLLLQ